MERYFLIETSMYSECCTIVSEFTVKLVYGSAHFAVGRLQKRKKTNDGSCIIKFGNARLCKPCERSNKSAKSETLTILQILSIVLQIFTRKWESTEWTWFEVMLCESLPWQIHYESMRLDYKIVPDPIQLTEIVFAYVFSFICWSMIFDYTDFPVLFEFRFDVNRFLLTIAKSYFSYWITENVFHDIP